MKVIKFNTIDFELKDDINISASHVSACLVKGDYGVDDILEELDGTTTITISEDEETVAVYNDYSKILAVTYHKDYDHPDNPVDTVCVELINEDIQAQIDAISGVINNVQTVQSSQSQNITNLNNKIDGQAQNITNMNSRLNKKLDADIVGSVETIGGAASKPYKEGDTFMGADGKYYKATTDILINSTLVEGGNCVQTNISRELQE